MPNNNDMITLVNKKTGESVTVPRSQFVEKKPSTGFEGIVNDIGSSLETALPAIGKTISSIPGGAKNVGKYAATNYPWETLANLGAGGVENMTALASSPQKLMRYLVNKFPDVGNKLDKSGVLSMLPYYLSGGKSVNDPTLYEHLQKFEQEHGLAPQSPEEASVRNVGGLLFGGKPIAKMPGMAARTGTIAATAAGAGGDPVHAAIMSMIAEGIGKGANKTANAINRTAGEVPPGSPPPPPPGAGASMGLPPTIKANMTPPPASISGYMTALSNLPKAAFNVAKAVPEAATSAVKAIPEMAGRTTAAGLEGIADYAAKTPVVGGLAQPSIGAIASYLKHISVPPEELARRNLFGDIEAEDLPEMLENDAAAKRLKLKYVTPSELSNSPYESVKQGDIGRTKKGQKLLYKEGEAREGTEEAAINTLFDLIHEDKLDPVMNEAYKKTMAQEVPQEFIDRQIEKPVIQEAMKAIKKKAAFKQMLQDEYGVKFDQVPANSFMFWDMIKRVLYDLEGRTGTEGGKTESSVYAKTRRSMVDELDKIAPDYKMARNISERKFTREKLEDVFDKKDKNFNNFDSFLKSKENYNDILHKLEPFPEATQQLKDIKRFAGRMIPNNPTVRAAAALKRTGMSDARNAVEAQKRKLDQKYGEEHDVAAVKLMTHPRLMDKLAEYLRDQGKI